VSGPATTLASLADIPVGHLESVARHRSWAKGLEALGVETVLDLITHYPRRYVDRTVQVDIAETVEGQEAMVLATVQSVTTRRARNGRPLVEATFSDRSGTLRVTFFNQPWRVRQLTEGTEAVLVGRLERFRGRRQMTNPLVDLLGEVTGRVVPVYPQSERAGLTSRDLGLMIGDALDHVAVEVVDSLPEDLRRREGLPDRTRALHQTHRPDSIEASRWARHRLGFEELLRLQLILVMRKRTIERESVGIRHQVDGELVERFRRRSGR
jgi:ATP-dependent DNA helicase RecG